jgi:type IV pilus assembly protein PilN
MVILLTKDINLLPTEIIDDRKSRERTNLIILLSILITVTAFSLLLIPYNQLLRLEGKKRHLKESISRLSNITAVEKKLEEEKGKLVFRKKVLSMIETEEYDILLVLEKIEKLIPEDIFFLSLTTSGNKLTISGAAKNKEAVADLIHSMKELNIFEDVFVPSIIGVQTGVEEDQAGIKNFTMNCTIKTGKGN